MIQIPVEIAAEKVVYDTSQFRQLLRGVKDGKYVLILKPWKNSRTNQQNRRYWALLTAAARELGNDDPEDLHEGLALKFLKLPPDDVTGLERRLSTTKLNTAEFNDYMDAVERFFVVDLHLDLSEFQGEFGSAA